MDPKLKQFGRRLLTGLFLVAFFVWLAQRNSDDAGRVHSRDLLGLGTLITLTVHLDAGQSIAALDDEIDRIDITLQAYERRWSQLGDAELAQLNRRLAAGEVVSLPSALQPLLGRAETLRQATGGRFDPRIGALVKLWQFDDQTRYRSDPPPAGALADAVAALAAAPALTPDQPYGPAPGVQFDLGGIAKGEAADLIADTLTRAGYSDYLVNMGGDVLSSGRRGERPWRIGIRHPRPRGAAMEMLALLPTEGREAVFTSGDYERLFIHQGQRYHHLLDPTTGEPARGLQSVTVVSTDPILADAATTALFVAGADWRSLAARLELDQVLVVDAEGRLQATPRLAERLVPAGGIQIETVP